MAKKCFGCNGVDPEWVAYGPCGHQIVCTTCEAWLRFIQKHFRCPVCHEERNVVFATKASAKARTDVFATFPIKPLEGPVDSFWYHEGSKTFFDDFEEYKRIKELCGIKCTSCGKANFSCIGDLMIHLHEQHRLYLCTVCLVDREPFVCALDLFTKEELNKHIREGDPYDPSNPDEEFKGHPHCFLCENPFNGEEKVIIHEEDGLCSCHVCDRLFPPVYNCLDCEAHFRTTHLGFHIYTRDPIPRAFKSQAEYERHLNMEHWLPKGSIAPASSQNPKAYGKKLQGQIRDSFFRSLKKKSRDYIKGIVDARTYMTHLEKFGARELAYEIAHQLPSSDKRKELQNLLRIRDDEI